ncbi:MAG: intermembrane transport protein PqiB [Burkholderiales bacterium]
MADTPRPPDLSGIPDAVAARKRKWSPQLVWLVPVVAALAGGWLAVQSILNTGPTITITFESANGIEPGKTQIKYKEVQIGLVTAMTFTPDRKRVLVTAEMKKEAEPFLVEDVKFWVVSPRVSVSSVSGLGTLFSGVYIGTAVGASKEKRREFTGLEVPPVLTSDQPGRHFVLKSETLGSIDIGSPVYFRQVQVGQVVAQELDKDGGGVSIQVFVNAPYHKFVKSRTRFWPASGIDVTLSASGIQVNTESLVALLVGGLAFRTPPDALDAPEADPNTVFNLFADRAAAFQQPDTVVQKFRLVFRESVRGLSVGAPVDFRGINIGEVKSIGIDFDRQNQQVLIVVDVDIYPERMRSRVAQGATDARERGIKLVEILVNRGLRAQLRTGNLLTGQLYVALDFFPGAAKVKLDTAKLPIEVPTIPSPMTELQASLAGILKKVDDLPLNELAADLRKAVQSLDKTLQGVDKLVQRLDTEVAPEARTALIEARKTLTEANQILSSESPVRQELQEMLREITRAAEAVRALADLLDRQPEALIRGKRENAP